jgi:hypothetical protein
MMCINCLNKIKERFPFGLLVHSFIHTLIVLLSDLVLVPLYLHSGALSNTLYSAAQLQLTRACTLPCLVKKVCLPKLA